MLRRLLFMIICLDASLCALLFIVDSAVVVPSTDLWKIYATAMSIHTVLLCKQFVGSMSLRDSLCRRFFVVVSSFSFSLSICRTLCRCFHLLLWFLPSIPPYFLAIFFLPLHPCLVYPLLPYQIHPMSLTCYILIIFIPFHAHLDMQFHLLPLSDSYI